MPPVQTSYSSAMTVAFAGMIADARDSVIESYAAETAAIPFGRAVIAGTDPLKQVKTPSQAGGVFRGITVAEQAQEQDSSGVVSYGVGEAANVGRRGLFWVDTAGAVVIDAPAFFVVTGGTAGKFDDLDDGTTDPVPTGVFRTATSGAALALLEINLPGSATSGS